jgi:hypothetical protein
MQDRLDLTSTKSEVDRHPGFAIDVYLYALMPQSIIIAAGHLGSIVLRGRSKPPGREADETGFRQELKEGAI